MNATLCPSDSSLLGALFHGHTGEVDNSGFQPNWMENPVAQEIVSAAFTLNRQHKAINLLNIMASARGINPLCWTDVKVIAANGYGDVDWRNAVKACQNNYMAREAQRLHDEIGRRLNDPKTMYDVNSWLPSINHQLTTLFDTGKSKDAKPSSLLDEEVPTIKFTSLIPGFNELWGGGYRSWMLAIYAGCPGHGKSTTLISHAVDGITQGKTVSMVVNELMPAVVARRVLRGCSGISEREIEAKRGDTTERHEMMMQWKSWMDSHLRIYDTEMYRPSMMRRIISWDRPDLLVIDYLRNFPGMLESKSQNVDPVGEMAYEMLNLYRDEKIGRAHV